MRNGNGKSLGFGREALPVSPRAGKRMGRTPFRYCKCGFPNDTRTTAWAYGANDGDGGLTWNGTEWVVSQGCAFCGRVQWLDKKPKALPDDENLPSKEWTRRRGK